ncbi:E3 ubiquitin-protein ligase SGR9, amyloplastic-like [Impatiens glandulifera]|uniref:E3 ubiquitin-protein ligase SGR9, amyloplastic-like n=1 Tax=Impatiens glandulifera TaxID=253017 RepID=UPI001FB1665D|nr:E3 ubiquitin-protein ligase SGR9, amyloplastic-like [Impatiens glandulifera]
MAEEEEKDPKATEFTIIATLSSLSPPQLSNFTISISSLFHRHCCRITAVVSSPSLFSLTLHHLNSLSLSQKSILIAHHLLSTLSPLSLLLHPTSAAPSAKYSNLHNLDAVLLLLLLCEIRQHNPLSLETPISDWRQVLCKYISGNMLTLSYAGLSNITVLSRYVMMVGKCRRFLYLMGFSRSKEVGAAAAAVVALPSVAVEGGRECVVCKEEMGKGRDVCKLPCGHLFHWICILPWLKKRNSCPCCRFRLPSDDVFGEIERLWEIIANKAAGTVVNCYRECV